MFYFKKSHLWGFPGGSAVKNLPAMQETAKTSTPGSGRYYHAEMYSKLSQIFFFSGILSLPSTPKMEPAQRRTTRGPQSSSSLNPEATDRTPRDHPGQTTERKGDLTKWVVKNVLCTYKELQKTCSCVPLEFILKEKRSVFNPPAHSCTQGEIRLELWHNFQGENLQQV